MVRTNQGGIQVMRTLFILLFIILAFNSYATHNRAGEIRFVQTGPLTIEATIITYTRASSVDADRDSLLLFWGDGTSTVLVRSNGNGNGVIMPNDIKYNLYTGVHTYPGRGTYTLSMTDPNRVGGILNVDPPNSIEIPFHLETTFTFLNPQFAGYNSSAILLQPPIDIGCVGQRFIHIPNAYDPDGDSIAYEMIVPMSGPGTPVPNYSFPNQIKPGPDNIISFNEKTGEFIWDAPQVVGEYNIAFYIKEYRNGELITKTIRDMQILVENCNNHPPEFQLPRRMCVIAGETVEIPITFTDPDIPTQQIKVEANGGPIVRGASIDIDDEYHNQPVHATFTWHTSCNDISEQYYNLVIKAVDNGMSPGNTGTSARGLSTLKILRIKVVGPAPQNDSISIENNAVVLSWDAPYACEVTEDDYFRGFTIWRREGASQASLDTCSFNLEAMGYQAIAFNIKDLSSGRYSFTDKAVEPGRTYCYRITGEFAQTTPAGNPYNIVESLPTPERCILLNRDLPALKNVSVLQTDLSEGKIYLRWLKPDVEALDTLENPGPYAFSIQRSTGIGNTTFIDIPGSMTDFSSFESLVDTIYVDSMLNTAENAYTYRIAFYTGGRQNEPYGYSAAASSVYLNIQSSDKINILSWQPLVPWYNFNYRIFRLDEQSGQFILLDSTAQLKYRDTDLINGKEYCYYIESVGAYGLPYLNDTLYNLSQRACGTPIDTLAPCVPELIINNICNVGSAFDYEELVNKLIWKFNNDCLRAPDVKSIKIFFKSDSTAEFQLIDVVSIDDNFYIHEPGNGLRGCYAISLLDSVGNESELSEIVCAENCPIYSLPNTFTPNGDGSNDIYGPITNRFIERIDFTVFNRWGDQIFHTTDPAINWDGKTRSGKLVSPGTYYYVCTVYGYADSTAPLTVLKGYIEIIY